MSYGIEVRRFTPHERDRLLEKDNLRAIGNLIDKYRGGVPEELKGPQKGAFNAWARLVFADGGSAIIRIPMPGKVIFPEEKVQREVEIMRFLTDKTSIPVPFVLHVGMTDESPNQLGPFIIMDFVEHDHDLCDALNTPGLGYEDRPILNPLVSMEQLYTTYSQMAKIMLQLSKHTFPEIGSISYMADEDRWLVTHRPLTLNMNELVQLGRVSPSMLPQGPFETSTSYYVALADMHITHLDAQRGNSMPAVEYKHKYIARCLFRRLAGEGKFCKYGDRGPFRLFNDDFRPANVVTNDKFQVTGALDWEFTYSATAEFASSAPFWLILDRPDYRTNGLYYWTDTYNRHFPVFMKALEYEERIAVERGVMTDGERLSAFIRDSWETGDFWVTYAAQRSWAFDSMYWSRIDRRFFGEGDIEHRLHLLTSAEREQLKQRLLLMEGA